MRRAAAATLLAALLALGCGEPAQREIEPTPGQELPAAPPALARACAAAGTVYEGTVRCPTRLPSSREDPKIEFGGRARDHQRCAWQVGLQLEGPAFHVLVGGQCRPFPLGTENGEWPDDPSRVQRKLGLIGRGPLRPGDPVTTIGPEERPTVVRSDLAVGGRQAMLVAYGTYPASGTVHGGHQALLWNVGGEGVVVSGHFDADVPGTLRLELLLGLAKSIRPAR